MDSQRILIVEDERIIALDLQRRLEKFGFNVVGIAAAADESVELAREYRPNLILMDIMLAGPVDGIEAATRIKQALSIPVVFLTAYADDTTIERAKDAEPFGYVLKPFKERELYTTIDMALYKSRLHAELLRQKRWFSSVLHSVADGLVATDHNYQVQLLNPVAETLTGFGSENAQGLPLSQVFQLYDDNTELKVSLPTSFEAETPRYFDHVYLKNKQGAEIHVEGVISVIHGETGEVEGIAIAFRDVSDIKSMSDKIVYQASHDALTGLINRQELFARVDDLIHNSRNNGHHHAFAYVDLDQFKVVNDVCGHGAGDELLRQIAQTIDETVAGNYILGRLGGDEFGLVFLDAEWESNIRTSQELLGKLRRKFIWQKNSFNVTASIGLVPIGGQDIDLYTVLSAADDACFLAKEEGGNSVKVYETADYSFLKRRGEMQWISRLTKALEEDRFVLYSQHIEPLRPELFPKDEILLRLVEVDGEMIDPGQFIPAAERYNLMPYIDRWVIRNVMHHVRQRAQSDLESRVYCVNISGASLADDSFLDYVVELFEETLADPTCFVLEVTETTAIENLTRAVAFMNRLKKLGVTFALDDFGNGFSSFAYLKRLPVDFLKIDGSFVRDIDQDKIDYAMVEAVNSIGHAIGMRTIAEFVGNETIRRMLTDMDVDYAQGFAISRPEPLERVGQLQRQ